MKKKLFTSFGVVLKNVSSVDFTVMLFIFRLKLLENAF